MPQQTLDVVKGNAVVKPIVSDAVPTAATEGASVGQTRFRLTKRHKSLTERFNEAYDEDARREDEEFFKTTKAYYRRRFNAKD